MRNFVGIDLGEEAAPKRSNWATIYPKTEGRSSELKAVIQKRALIRYSFLYLVTVMDRYSRKVLSYRLSNTMDPGFCVKAQEEAIDRYWTPEISNTDQGSQFTSDKFTGVLSAHSIRISINGKSRWVDIVFVGRLWRCVKYKEVNLKAYESPR